MSDYAAADRRDADRVAQQSILIQHIHNQLMRDTMAAARAIAQFGLGHSGGTWDTRSESFQGNVAEQVLRSYDFDQLFIGADGIDVARGSTTFNELVGLSRVMAEVSREVIVMVESQKIGRKMPNLELTWSQINVLITDDLITQEAKQLISQQGVEVLIAQ